MKPIDPYDDDDALDDYIAAVKREQERCIGVTVPMKIADLMSEVYGDGWIIVPDLAAKYDEAVQEIQAQLSAAIEVSNADFEAHRREGFRDDWRPIRH